MPLRAAVTKVFLGPAQFVELGGMALGEPRKAVLVHGRRRSSTADEQLSWGAATGRGEVRSQRDRWHGGPCPSGFLSAERRDRFALLAPRSPRPGRTSRLLLRDRRDE